MTNEVTGASERHDNPEAVGSPLERPVRPAGYNRPPTGEPTNPEDWNAGYEAGMADGVAAERKRWRALIEARAAGCERAAENTEDPKFDVMARVLMSVREDGDKA